MRVLDIDLDFFLLGVAYYADDEDARLPSEEFQPWHKDDVRTFMEQQLGLNSRRKTSAILCVHHDEVLYHCEELIRRQLLTKPFVIISRQA